MLIAALVLSFLWPIFFDRDFWPFTRYPMFSRYRNPQRVCVICFALETSQGELTWWRPRFYRYPEYLGRQLTGDDVAKNLWCVGEIIRLVRLEKGDTQRLAAVHIIERRWVADGVQDVQDRILARIPVGEP